MAPAHRLDARCSDLVPAEASAGATPAYKKRWTRRSRWTSSWWRGMVIETTGLREMDEAEQVDIIIVERDGDRDHGA